MSRNAAWFALFLAGVEGVPVSSSVSSVGKCRPRPMDAQCCYTDKSSPAIGGIDMVDLATKAANGVPSMGSAEFKTMLNGYSFYFLNAENRDAFNADPWNFAPAYGGF